MSTRLTGYRRIQTQGGDTLQRVAARAMGDARRWYELAEINGLVPPFITDNPELAGPKVLRAGDDILVPAMAAPATGVSTDTSADILGTDIKLTERRMTVTASGDVELVSGVANMVQAVRQVIHTNPGELLFHLEYGSGVRTLIGDPADTLTNRLAASFIRRALLADERIVSTAGIKASVVGDSIPISGTAVTVDNKQVTVGG
jgi:phage baseplate assembly protein W